MKKNNSLFLIFVICCLCFSSTATGDTVKDLSLDEAIQIGINQNFDIKSAEILTQLSELQYQSKEYLLYSPQVKFYSTVSNANTIIKSKTSGGSGQLESNTSKNFLGTAEIGVEISEFNLFNGGRDQDALSKAKLQLLSNKIQNKLTTRQSIFMIISNYFKIYFLQKGIEDQKNILKISKSILDLTKKKKQLNVINETDMLFAKNDFFQRERELIDLENNLTNNLLAFNQLLNQPRSSQYRLVTKFEYEVLQYNEEYFFKFATQAPDYLRAEGDLMDKQINLKLNWKDITPLPKLTLSGIKLGHHYKDHEYSGEIRTYGQGPNWDLALSLNWEVPLWGENGVFNNITIKKAEMEVALAKYALSKTKKNLESEISTQFNNLKTIEHQISSIKDGLVNSSQLLDKALSSYTSGSATREEMLGAIRAFSDNNKNLNDYYYNHLDLKLQMAKNININYLFKNVKAE